ncbi:hypothetical protein D3C81_1726580 [compost metagenome]
MGAVGDHFERPFRADQTGQALRAAGARQQAEMDFGQAAFRAARGNAVVAHQRHLQSAAERGAVDGGDHRLGAVLDGRLHLGQPGRHQRLAELGDIGAGNEGLAGTGQHDALHRRIGDAALDPLQDAGAHGCGQRIDGWRIDGQHGDIAVHGQAGDCVDGGHASSLYFR